MNKNRFPRHTPTLEPDVIAGPRGHRFRAPPGVRNLKVTLSYDGAGFCGYQYQPHVKTVQYVLEQAWHILTKEWPALFGCSRLDTGVSAYHYVLNVYSRTEASPDQITKSLNGILRTHLSEPIAIYRVEEVHSEFNARFDSCGKHYRYLLWKGNAQHALITPQCWQIRTRKELRPESLSHAAQLFVGNKDFSAYRAADCGAKNTVKEINAIQVYQPQDMPELMQLHFWGDGFLKNMIRNIVGTLVDTATGKLSHEDITLSFSHKDRSRTGQCAPGHGLSLQQVFFSKEEKQESLAKLKKSREM